MNRIYEDQEIIIFSDKTIKSNNGRILTFTDGSSVDVESRRIVNKGASDIIIKDLPLWPAMAEILREQRDYDGIAHLIVSGDINNIIIIPDESPYCTVSLGGADRFVQNTSIRKQDDRLYIETPRCDSNVHINMDSIWINGKRLAPKLDEDFGFIEIKCSTIESFYVNSTGTGSIFLQSPIGDLQAKIKGSTSIDAVQIANANVEISGSGNITVNQLKGNLRGRISGSGSIDILDGEIGDIDVTVSGSGSLLVGATARTASLFLSGSGEILIAHIVDGYVEQKTGSGFIKVLRKGI